MDNQAQIQNALDEARQVAIVVHTHPDGDAIGSGLAMKRMLEKQGKQVTLISPDQVPEYLRWLPGSEAIIEADARPAEAVGAIREADRLLMLDHNHPGRTGKVLEPVVDEKIRQGKALLIDHHLEPDPRIRPALSEPGYSSTAELVYRFFKRAGWWPRWADKATATQLYTGIMTDTGSFRFGSTTGDTHRAVADLIDRGADNEAIHVQIYDTYSLDKMRLLAHALQNMQLLEDCGASYMVLDRPTLERFHFKPGDTEGIVNYGISLKDARFTTLITEQPGLDHIKLSFRSKGDFDVNRFARRYFDGGGHKNAAGGRSFDSLPETVRKLEEAIKENCQEIKGR